MAFLRKAHLCSALCSLVDPATAAVWLGCIVRERRAFADERAIVRDGALTGKIHARRLVVACSLAFRPAAAASETGARWGDLFARRVRVARCAAGVCHGARELATAIIIIISASVPADQIRAGDVGEGEARLTAGVEMLAGSLVTRSPPVVPKSCMLVADENVPDSEGIRAETGRLCCRPPG